MRRMLTVLIVTCIFCAVMLAACTERSNRSATDSPSASVNFSDTIPQVSESNTSSKMPVVSSPTSGTSGTAASHGQSKIASRTSIADTAYSGEWMSKGVTSLYDQGGYSLTLVIHTDGTASGNLGHASYHIGHEADADFTGTARTHIVTAAYRDDGWGHAGMLKNGAFKR